ESLDEKLSELLHVADNDRISGKMLIHEYLRWKQRPQALSVTHVYDEVFAQKLLRNYGLAKYNEYLDSFKEKEQEDLNLLPKLQIFDSLKILIKTIPACIYDENRTEDVKGFSGDDPY